MQLVTPSRDTATALLGGWEQHATQAVLLANMARDAHRPAPVVQRSSATRQLAHAPVIAQATQGPSATPHARTSGTVLTVSKGASAMRWGLLCVAVLLEPALVNPGGLGHFVMLRFLR